NAVVNHLQNPFPFFPNQRQARRPHPFLAQTTLLDSQFDVLHKLRVCIQVEQGDKPAVESPRLFPSPAAGYLPEILILPRKGDSRTSDPAVYAQNGRLEHQVIHTGEERVASADDIVQVRDTTWVA